MNAVFRIFIASLCCVFAAISPARAEVINISGQQGIWEAWSPLGVTFDAGSYTVTPVTQATPGALFTAYNFGGGYGWGTGYGIALSQDDRKYYGSGSYSTAEDAFAHAVGASFSLTKRQTVYFGVLDSYYGDNSGGVSLNITAVPEPETFALMLAGLGLLGFMARRKRML
ncbi:MAG: PEP-CTERM sorting domain-containing protein [Rhodocyclaceae bacterium]|nr:PEP-CTERM sorting domain-containing protein [Rhodocyclaceae bacterium]